MSQYFAVQLQLSYRNIHEKNENITTKNVFLFLQALKLERELFGSLEREKFV